MAQLLLKKMAFASAVFLFTPYSSANEMLNQPLQLQTYYQPNADGNKLCLMPGGNEGEVTLGECSKQAKPDGMFLIVKTDSQYYTIRPANNSGHCLRTFSGNQDVKLANCIGNNETPGNYSSMRSWTLIRIDRLFKLENKYKSDTGSLFSCLSVSGSGSSVGVGECTLSGNSSEYNNMRLWQLIF